MSNLPPFVLFLGRKESYSGRSYVPEYLCTRCGRVMGAQKTVDNHKQSSCEPQLLAAGGTTLDYAVEFLMKKSLEELYSIRNNLEASGTLLPQGNAVIKAIISLEAKSK